MPAGEIPRRRCWESVFQLPTCSVLAPNPSGTGTALTQRARRENRLAGASVQSKPARARPPESPSSLGPLRRPSPGTEGYATGSIALCPQPWHRQPHAQAQPGCPSALAAAGPSGDSGWT